MFGLRRWFGVPRPPLDEFARQWIDTRLAWLRGEFGAERLIDSPVIEPTDRFFPDAYDGGKASVQRLFERVCAYMDVSPAVVQLRAYSEARRPGLVNADGELLAGSAGTYQEGSDRFLIRLERGAFAEPMQLVGTIAHELSHLRLLGENRADPEAFDNELLTDLTAVFFGFGIFMANAPRHWHSDLTYWPETQLRRPEYMTLPMYGYALALIAQVRYETKPRWLRHLRGDARAEFWASHRFLERARSD
jgi:hypothetical protein